VARRGPPAAIDTGPRVNASRSERCTPRAARVASPLRQRPLPTGTGSKDRRAGGLRPLRSHRLSGRQVPAGLPSGVASRRYVPGARFSRCAPYFPGSAEGGGLTTLHRAAAESVECPTLSASFAYSSAAMGRLTHPPVAFSLAMLGDRGLVCCPTDRAPLCASGHALCRPVGFALLSRRGGPSNTADGLPRPSSRPSTAQAGTSLRTCGHVRSGRSPQVDEGAAFRPPLPCGS
jgi:hypothetical protein